MPRQERFKTQYPGVYYITGKQVGTGKLERIYYIMYRREGQLVEEKAGRQYQHDMTPARAAAMRAERIRGHVAPNQERREAERSRKEAEAQRTTFDKLWGLYLENKPNLKGRAQDESRYRRFIGPTFGDREPRDLLPLDVDRLRLRLLKTYSPQTTKHALALLRRLIRWGAAKGLCVSPSFQIEVPAVHNEVTEDLNAEQVARLLEAIEKDHHPHAGPMMKLALLTGMRKGELLGLRWQDIDLERGLVRLVNPKSGCDAILPINQTARELLTRHPHTEGSDYVFAGQNGKRRQEIRRPINRIRRAAGLPPNFRPLHGLRHYFASALASSGEVDMHVIQKLLTHRSASTTGRYSHLRDATLRQAAEKAGRLVAEAVNGEPAKVVKLGNGGEVSE